jgi:hypothetical protein
MAGRVRPVLVVVPLSSGQDLSGVGVVEDQYVVAYLLRKALMNGRRRRLAT